MRMIYEITPTYTKEVEVIKLDNGEVMLKLCTRDEGCAVNTNHTYLGEKELEQLGNELIRLSKESR